MEREHQTSENVLSPKSDVSKPNLNESRYNIFDWEDVPGKKMGSTLKYTKEEQRLYSSNSVKNQFGIAHRCYDRSCKARRILCPNGLFIALKGSPEHTCKINHVQLCIDLRADNELKTRCSQIETIAGGSKMATVRSIFKGVIQE